MKKCSKALIELLEKYRSGELNTWYIAELYTIWLTYDLAYNSGLFDSGAILLRTGHDVDLTVGGNKYIHGAIEHGDITENRGTETSTMDLTINYGRNDTIAEIGSVTWFEALQNGTFDNAYLALDRLYSPIPWQYNMPNISSDYVLKDRFWGRIDIQTVKINTASMQVKSISDMLNTQLPRNLVKPSCLNRFCDFCCQLDKDTYKYPVIAGTNSNRSVIVIAGGFYDDFFSQGTMMGVSGKNVGVIRTIKSFANGQAIPARPFANDVAEGDKFTFWRGCDKTMKMCRSYSNISNFRGFPFLPTQNVLL